MSCILRWGLFKRNLRRYRKRAARFVTSNYICETGSMTGILEQLKWESLKNRRRDGRIIMLYKGLKGAASIHSNDLVSPIRHVRKHHFMTSYGLRSDPGKYCIVVNYVVFEANKIKFKPESITLWHFKPPLLILTFTRAVSSPRLLEIGIYFQIVSFLLLNVQKILLLSSLLL